MRLTYTQQEEYDRLRREKKALYCAVEKMIAWEAAVQVILAHGLVEEWTDKIRSMQSDGDQQ